MRKDLKDLCYIFTHTIKNTIDFQPIDILIAKLYIENSNNKTTFFFIQKNKLEKIIHRYSITNL